MRLRPARVCALVTATTLLGASLPSRAFAQTTPANANADAADDPEALIARGVALRHEGKDAEALKVFRRAVELNPSARARAQLGLCEQALGMWVEAERDLAAALDAPDAFVKQYRQPIESALGTVRARVGSLEIVVNVAAADVLIDGAKVGTAPGPALRVVAGPRTVVVQAEAYHPISRSVVVPGGGVARETFELAPLPPAPANEGAPRGMSGANAATGAPGGEGETPPNGSGQRMLGWGLLGGSVLVLGGGLAAQLVQQGAVRDYNQSSCPGEASATQPPPCDDLISKSERWQALAIVGFAAGGALAIAGTVLVATAAPRPVAAPAPRASTNCGGAPILGGAAVFCHF